MDLRRMLRDLDEVGRSLVEGDQPRLDDKADGYELTVSARDFSQAARKVVDEKLTFSATLLRAGEVAEAKRILAEVESDVRNEEAALIEKVNEVSAKRAVTRAHMTRLRLVRLLATAMVGAGLLGISAMGMALAGMFEEPQNGRVAKKGRVLRLADARDADTKRKQVVIGGMKVKLSKKDLETFRRLTSGSVDTRVLERFLASDLELPAAVVDETIATVLSLADPAVVKKVQDAVVTTTTTTTEVVADLTEPAKKKSGKAKEAATAGSDDEPGPTEPAEPAAEEEPPPPETEQTDDDDDDDADRDGDGGQKTLSGVKGL
jgi:hypothetical protein